MSTKAPKYIIRKKGITSDIIKKESVSQFIINTSDKVGYTKKDVEPFRQKSRIDLKEARDSIKEAMKEHRPSFREDKK